MGESGSRFRWDRLLVGWAVFAYSLAGIIAVLTLLPFTWWPWTWL